MNMWKCVCSFLLCVMLLVSTVPSSGIAQQTMDEDLAQGDHTSELDRAVTYGISLTSIVSDAPLTWQQFCGMLATALAKADNAASARFVQDAGTGMTRTDPMNRDAAMLACFYASTEVGMLSNYGEGFELYRTLGDAVYDEMAWDYGDTFPTWHEPAYANENPWDDHLTASYFYNLSYRSPLSEKRMFEYDEATNSLHLNQPITGEEGVCAIVRLMDGIVEMIPMTAAAPQVTSTQEAPKVDVSYVSLGAMTITKDGHHYQTTGYRGDATGDIYVPSSTMEVLFGEHTEKVIQQEQKPYENLTAMCAQKQVSSYTYDDVLNAVYIWSYLYDHSRALSEAKREDSRIASYGFGEPTDDGITYQDFFAIMDQAVDLVNADKLKDWQSSFVSLRSSQSVPNRFEAMVAILRLALALGDDYSEFNNVQYDIINAIGDDIWSQINQISNIQKIKGNPLFEANFPYDLGGFQNSPEVCEWDMTGVAYDYSLMRKSNASGNILFDYDEANNSLHLDAELTYRDALSAVVRLLDSTEETKFTGENYVSIDDERILTPNAAYLPNVLLEQATDIVNPLDGGKVKAFGAVLSEQNDISPDPIKLPYVEGNIRRYANWGFNMVRYMIPYFKLFSDDGSTASILMFEQLDQVVAYALQYKIHLNFTLTMLPGHWFREGEDYAYYGEFDLFLNKEQQKEAMNVWRTIAERYRDVPVNALSFNVMWETMNQNLSTGLPFKRYTIDDAKTVCADLAQTVASVTPNRLAVYELENSEYPDDGQLYQYVQSKCSNSVFSLNYSSMPFVYANMTAVEGEHIDNCNRSMFQSLYPVTYYEAQMDVSNEKPLIVKGDLSAGTEIQLYLARTYDKGKLTVYADDTVIYEEELPSQQEYVVTNKLSTYVSYAESDKSITVTLPSDTKEIRFENTSCFNWCGMAVTLPQTYAVKRWFMPSTYESFLENGEKNYDLFPYEKETSVILISPTIIDSTPITIHSDVSYSTDVIAAQSNVETVYAWFKQAAAKYPGVLVRCESADFSGEYYSQVRYYEDVLSAIHKYGLGFLSNDFSYNNYVFVDTEHALKLFMGSSQINVPYENGWLRMDMFKVYQKYFPITVLEDKR